MYLAPNISISPHNNSVSITITTDHTLGFSQHALHLSACREAVIATFAAVAAPTFKNILPPIYHLYSVAMLLTRR